jgi:NADPH:quinone reductase-like Zn-dependent oxidoreductase/malonyl CoA-acyl carrier protein transacylase/SAM-dependent methyltransferase
MGAELLHVYPVYASSLKRSAIWLQEDGAKWDLLQELWKPNSESRINDAELSQPFCTALQIALVDLLQSFDVIFDTVCGHSSGEIAAAYAAGFLEGRDALRIAFLRGRAISQLRIDWPQLSGSMLAVGLPAADVEKYLNSDEGSIGVAAINSPRSVTLSGDKVAIQGVQAKLNSDGIFNRMLLVDVAYHHAAHMEKIQDEYVAQIGELSSPRRKVVSRMVSSVSGQEIYETDLNAAYWGRNLVSPVLFADALTKAFSHSSPSVKQVVVEVGPHAALRGPIKETFKVLSRPLPLDYQSLIIRGKHAGRSTLQVLGALFEHGVHLRFEQVLHGLTTGTPRVMYSLPTYPWTHGRQHWIESRISKQYRHRRFAPHDLLGTLVSGSTSTNLSWRHYIDVKRLPWVRGHKITSHIAFPATGYVCAVIEALRQCATDEGRSLKNTIFHFRHISITKALFLSEDERNIEFVVMLHPYDNPNADSTVPWRGFTVATVTKSGETMIHCSGLAACKSHDAASDVQDCMGDTARSIASIDFSRLTKLNTRRFYEQVKSIGIDYTGPFASLSKINASLGCVVCVASIPDVRSMMPALHQQAHCIHPATLDTCFQAVLVMMQSIGKLHASVLDRIDELIVSANISSQPGTELFVIGKSVNNPSTGDISVRQGYKEGPLVIEARGIHMAKQQDVSTLGSHSFSQRTVWHEDPRFAKATDIVGIATTSQHNEYVTRRHNLNNEFCRRVIGNVLASLSSDDEGRVKSHFLRYLQWMRLPGHSSSEPVTEAIRKEITSLGIVSEALLRFETELHSILIGDVDPMSVFFKDELLSGIYNDPYVQVNHLAAKYVELLESKNPNLRILVIGAGTASTTASILHHVYANGRRCKLGRFVFTDASPEFLEFTRDKLVSFADVLEFRTLDIESSPAEQGFGPGDFDLVIASNVSHGTDSTRKSIGNTRALLKPGGYLVLLEPVLTDNGPLSLPLLFGMLPSWWLGHEDGNEKSPLLSISQWHETLLKNGFSGLDVELQNYPDDRHEVSVLISTASPTSEQPKPTRLSVISCFETDTLANEVLRLALMRNPSIHVEKGTMDVVGSSSCYVILLEMVQSFLASCTEDQWKHFKHVLSQAQTVLWVTKGSSMEATHPFRALIHGTSRSFRAEEHSIVLATLDLDPTCGSLTYAQEAEWIYKVYVHLVSTADDRDPPDFEFAIRNGRLLIPRIVEDNQIDSYVKDIVSNYHPVRGPIEQKERVLQLHVETPGLLDTLHWRDSKRHGRPINANEVRVQMRYLSLNFKDLMIALGQLEGYSSLLIEGAGVVLEVGKSVRKMFAVGDLVAGFAPDSLATTANIDHRNVHHVPHGMPLEHAASIPVVYCTAYHSLVNIARIQEGEALLVHSAAGAVGQAAVALAQYLKVTEIYVTVGSAEKRQLMMEQFGIPQTNIFSSRNTTFKQSILRRTNGRGVDVVLNSLTGESARESLNLLAPFGRFIEIGKKDILTNARQEMLPLEKNITFATVDLSLICRDKVEIFTPLLGTVFNLVHSGKVQMISPISIHALTKFHETFKIMQLGKHTGKLIMSIDEDVHIPIQPKQPKPPTLNPEASYLVVGGTGGLGRAIIRHLVYLGAKHVITLSRSGSTNEEVSELIADLEVKGIELVVFKGSVTKQEDVEALGDHTRGRPIRGIIQAAMQLQVSLKSLHLLPVMNPNGYRMVPSTT